MEAKSHDLLSVSGGPRKASGAVLFRPEGPRTRNADAWGQENTVSQLKQKANSLLLFRPSVDGRMPSGIGEGSLLYWVWFKCQPLLETALGTYPRTVLLAFWASLSPVQTRREVNHHSGFPGRWEPSCVLLPSPLLPSWEGDRPDVFGLITVLF